MTDMQTPLWKQCLKGALFLSACIAIPLGLGSDGFLTWISETSHKENWENADAIGFRTAECYRWTSRHEQAAAAYEKFVARWPQHELTPEAVYQVASCLRHHADEIDRIERGSPEKVVKVRAIKERAGAWFDWMWQNYPNHPRSMTAQRAAQSLRDGY